MRKYKLISVLAEETAKEVVRNEENWRRHLNTASLPLETGAMGLNDRMDFMNMFQKQINDMKLLSQKRTAAYYQYSMQAYWDFILEWEMQKWARVQAAYPL